MGNGLKKPGSEQPENFRLPLGLTRCKSETEIPQASCGLRGLAFHQLQNSLVEHFTCVVAVRMRLGHWRHFRLKPAPLIGPQIGRMNAVGSHKLLNIAVLRKQGYGGKWLIGQYAFEILSQGEAGVLDFDNRVPAAQLRLLHELLYSGLHGAEHHGRLRKTNHFQYANGLMELLAGSAQLAGVGCGQIGTGCCFSLFCKSPERLDGSLQRFAQFTEHPGQRAQVIHDGIGFGGN